MGALQELSSSEELSSFLSTNAFSLVCFSATWCGPCKASKPQLETLAASYASDPNINVSCCIVYEHNLGEAIQNYRVRAFPTYALFQQSSEVGRVEGVNFEGIKSLVEQYCKGHDFGSGNSLGGGGAAVSAEDARAQRLARFGAAASPLPVEKKAADPPVKDEEMKEAVSGVADKMDVDDEEKCAEVEMIDPTENLKKEDIETLTNSMGFSEIRAQKGLINGNGTVEGAVEWLLNHQDDDDIDDPIEKVPKGGVAVVAQSYKCNECGKTLSNMANLELHANKTGHSDFEESTELKKPLTEEEKAAKILEIKSLLKAKRAEREETEKKDNVDREKQRRFMGQEMQKTREEMEIEARKRMAKQRKKEKEDALKERQRIRAELEKDKRERAANKGKLTGRLGVDGYNPSGIQYEVNPDGTEEDASARKKKAPPSAAKMDEYISKVSSYRAGGDGGNCLKILKAYIGNVVKNPDEPKYKKINMENKAYKAKVKPFLGAKNLLLAIGFAPTEDGTTLELTEDADMEVLKQANAKVEAAYEKYMK
ncbi:hypothetical protein ACHAWT_003373 [Skeletonema menzelii]